MRFHASDKAKQIKQVNASLFAFNFTQTILFNT